MMLHEIADVLNSSSSKNRIGIEVGVRSWTVSKLHNSTKIKRGRNMKDGSVFIHSHIPLIIQRVSRCALMANELIVSISAFIGRNCANVWTHCGCTCPMGHSKWDTTQFFCVQIRRLFMPFNTRSHDVLFWESRSLCNIQ